MQYVDSTASQKGSASVAGKTYSVVSAPRPGKAGTLRLVQRGLTSLFTGLRTTIGYFLQPKTRVTQQYPENRATLKMHDRYRASLEFLSDDGFHRCTGCRICERECPNGSIIIDASKGLVTKKWEVDRYVWRLDTCTFCNICVQVCPFEAIDFTGKFESAVYDRRLLVFNLNEYAGPHASLAAKMVPDAAEREKLKRPCDAYTGELPLNGAEWAGIPALPGASEVQTTVVPGPDTIEMPVLPPKPPKPAKPVAPKAAEPEAAAPEATAPEATEPKSAEPPKEGE